MGWAQFVKLPWEVLAATDFFTIEVATWQGLVTYSVLGVMELTTRRVQIAGITPYPTAAFMQQCARQLTDPCEGFLLGKRYRLHDRDTKCTLAFDALLKDSGVSRLAAAESASQCPLRTVRALHQGGGVGTDDSTG
jgi:putative transposase